MLKKIIYQLRKNQYLKKNKNLRKILKKMSIIFVKIIYGDKVKVKIGGKYEFFLDSRFAFSNYENWGGKHNIGFEKLLEVSKNKSIVLDIGGHIGLTALPLSRVIKKNGKVYVFEPSNINRFYLNKHLKLNNIHNVFVYDYLVGDKKIDNVEFYEMKDVSGTQSIINIKTEFKKTYKQQITLDDFCFKNNIKPEVIKIDIEGAEYLALRGAKKIINMYKPIIILSLHPKHLKMMGEDITYIFKFIQEVNYDILSCETMKEINSERELRLSEYLLRSKN